MLALVSDLPPFFCLFFVISDQVTGDFLQYKWNLLIYIGGKSLYHFFLSWFLFNILQINNIFRICVSMWSSRFRNDQVQIYLPLSEKFKHFFGPTWTDFFSIMIKCKQILMDALLYLMCEVISVCSAGNLSLKSQ